MKFSKIGDSLYIKGRIGWKGLKKSEYLTDGEYRIINATSIVEGQIDWSDAGFISKERYDESPEIMLQNNDILISKDGTIGKVGLVSNLSKPATVASGVFVVRNLNHDKWNTKYLYYYFMSIYFKNFIESRKEGSVIPHLYQRDFEQLNIPEYSITIQNKIVDILDSITNKIRVNQQINDNLLELARIEYDSMISTAVLHNGVLSDIADIVMGQSPKSNTYNNNGIGLPLLNGAADFKNGKIEANKYTTDPKKIAQADDYIFGVRATIGQTTKIFKRYAIGRGTGSAHPKEVYFDEYLFFVLQDAFKWFSQTSSGSVYINISKSDFNGFRIPIPDDQSLLRFHKTTKPFLDKIYQNNAEISKLTSLRDSMLPKLLSGEIELN